MGVQVSHLPSIFSTYKRLAMLFLQEAQENGEEWAIERSIMAFTVFLAVQCTTALQS